MGTLNRKSDFLKVEKRDNVANDPQFSFLTEFWETTEASRERSAQQLFDDFGYVMLVTEASNLGEPTTSCVNDIFAISNKCVAPRFMSLWQMPKHIVLCFFPLFRWKILVSNGRVRYLVHVSMLVLAHNSKS